MKFLLRYKTALALIGVTLLALVLRLANIGTEPFWGDEILSLDAARHFATAKALLSYLALVEFHPPLFYLLLRPWTAAFGTSEAAVRTLPLLFSVASIPLTYELGRRLFGKRAGLAAAFVMAVLPMQIEFGQEARPYAMFCCMGIVAAIAAWEARRSVGWRWPALYVAASAVGLYLHYSFLFVLAAIATWWFYAGARDEKSRRGGNFLRWLCTHALVFLAFLPWLTPFLYKLLLGRQSLFGIMRPTYGLRAPDALFLILDQLVWMTKLPQITVAEIAGKAMFLLGLAATAWLQPRQVAPGKENERPALGYMAWLLLATVALFGISPQAVPYTPLYAKHAIFAQVPLALLLGWLCGRVKPKFAALLLVLFSMSMLTFDANVMGDDSVWDGMHRIGIDADFINRNYQKGDLVMVGYGYGRSNLQHYLRSDIPVAEIYPVDYYGNDVGNSPATLGLLENEFQVRMQPAPLDAVRAKLDRLDARYHPARIWFYDMPKDGARILALYQEKGWRHAFTAYPPLFQVDLMARP